MSVDVLHADEVSAQPFTEGEAGARIVSRLQAAFERSRNPMLIADDERRWVTGNMAAATLFDIGREEIAWRTMDEFTAPRDRGRLEEQWRAFLLTGAAEGRYELELPPNGSRAVEFSATANVLPARHLSVFFLPDDFPEQEEPIGPPWAAVPGDWSSGAKLTKREREVLSLVAGGLQNPDMAERLFLSPETIKSHVHNAMEKLETHTRAHAVAVAMVTGQIAWDTGAEQS